LLCNAAADDDNSAGSDDDDGDDDDDDDDDDNMSKTNIIRQPLNNARVQTYCLSLRSTPQARRDVITFTVCWRTWTAWGLM